MMCTEKSWGFELPNNDLRRAEPFVNRYSFWSAEMRQLQLLAKETIMLHKTVVALTAVLALGTAAVSTSAFARSGGGGGGHHGGGFGGHFGGGFARSHFGGGFREGQAKAKFPSRIRNRSTGDRAGPRS
jgi:hypothetical protein